MSRDDDVPDSKTADCEKDLALRQAWVEALIDKQYRLYVWNDSRVQMLATVNGLLFAAAGVIFHGGPRTIVATILFGVAAMLILFSLFVCLGSLHIFPHSGRSQESGDEPNIRSLNGIAADSRWRNYAERFEKISANEFLNHSLRQVWGMSRNNLKAHARARRGVRLTILGASVIFLALVAQMLPSIGPALPDAVRSRIPQPFLAADLVEPPAAASQIVPAPQVSRANPKTNP